MRKIIAVFAGGVLILFSWFCFTIRKTREESVEKVVTRHSPAIVGVQTKSGEHIEFRKNVPATVRGDAIVGYAVGPVELDKDNIKLTKKAKFDGSAEEFQTKDGRIFKPVTPVTTEGDKLTFKAYQSISVPLSNVQLVWVRTANVPATIALNAGIVLAVAGVTFAILAEDMSSSEYEWGGPGGGGPGAPSIGSCPFIFSDNGEEYVFDAEPYGTAVCRGLKRTDYIQLDHLKMADGKYKLLLTNQLNETDYTDEVKLIAVDHPRGTRVVPDAWGRPHTFTQPSPPQKATDQGGRDILPLIAQSDKLFWVTDLETRDPVKAEDLRDELTFEFAKPADARRAKLLVNAWTTLWGAAMADRFLELRGREIQAWYDDVNRHGPEFAKVMNWFANEELYLLKIWVETKDGWKVRGIIPGGEPRLTKDKAFLLDVRDCPGESLRIKLRPPVNFWMVNSLAVDYSQDLPVETTEMSALEATDQDGLDVRMSLAALDDGFLATSNDGGRAEIVFAVPPLKSGLDRTILLKAAGYYDIRLDTTAEPRLQLFNRAENEPGFAVRYAFEEYKRWEEGLRASLGKH